MGELENYSPYYLDFDEMSRLLSESTVDFPQSELSGDLWELDGQTYKLLPSAKAIIMRTLEINPVVTELISKAKDIRVIGSMATNLYQDDSDIDVHLVLTPEATEELGSSLEEVQKELKSWSHEHPEYIGDHPIELYIQTNPAQDLLSDGAYSITQDKWLKGPLMLDDSYNPYEVYSHVMSKVKEFADDAHIDLGELKMDVVDYNTIKQAYLKLPEPSKAKLKEYLDGKLQEIEDDIDALLANKKEWVELRKHSSAPTTEEQALKDVELSKEWKDANAVFKLLNRYGLIKVITSLEDVKDEDQSLQHKDVPKVAKAVGVK